MNEHKPHPLRIQRKRTKGSRLPPDVICCTRPGPWGNPFKTAEEFRRLVEAILGISGQSEFHEVELGEFSRVYWIANHLAQLRGKTLACWCSLDKPCHVDVLAELANRVREVPS